MSQIFYFILYDIDPTLYTILIKAITYLHPFTIPQSTTGTELRKKNEDSSALFLVSSGIRRITNACNLETKIGQDIPIFATTVCCCNVVFNQLSYYWRYS
jgi:hypothetical protein